MSNDYWQVDTLQDGRLRISYEDSFVMETLVVLPNNEAYRLYLDDETGEEYAVPVNLAEALRDLVKRIDEAGRDFMKMREWLKGAG